MNKIKILLGIILLISVNSFAGTSIFGLKPNSLGSVNMENSTASTGRGGFAVAYFDTLSLNNSNFAQWPYLTQTTINLNAGYKRLSTEISSQNTTSYSGNFTGGYLAVPVMNKKIALGFGLSPLLSSEQSVSLIKNKGEAEVIETLKATGNITEGSFSVGYAFSENLSIAGIIHYNFGLIEDELFLNYNTQGYSDISLINNYKVYGTSFGFHSFYKINENFYSGLRFKLPSKLTLKSEQNSINSTEYITESREINFPLNFTYGMAYLFGNNYIAGFDFNYQAWKNGYKINGEKQNGFVNSYRMALGIEKMPGGRRFVPFHQRMYYRGGIYFGQLNIQSNNKNVFEYGIGLGIGLPIMSPKDRIDLALQYGIRGNLSENLASENIFKINVSITAGSLWFIREDN